MTSLATSLSLTLLPLLDLAIVSLSCLARSISDLEMPSVTCFTSYLISPDASTLLQEDIGASLHFDNDNWQGQDVGMAAAAQDDLFKASQGQVSV